MKGIDKIKNKIISDANAEIKGIDKEIDSQIDEIKEKNRKVLDDLKTTGNKQKQQEIKLFKDKTLAQSRLKVKRNYLETREQIIVEFIEKSAEQAIGHADYKRFIENLIKNDSGFLGKDITIYCNSRDNDMVSNLAKGMKVKEIDISGGVILEDAEGKRINDSLNSILERKRDELRHKIIETLGK